MTIIINNKIIFIIIMTIIIMIDISQLTIRSNNTNTLCGNLSLNPVLIDTERKTRFLLINKSRDFSINLASEYSIFLEELANNLADCFLIIFQVISLFCNSNPINDNNFSLCNFSDLNSNFNFIISCLVFSSLFK